MYYLYLCELKTFLMKNLTQIYIPIIAFLIVIGLLFFEVIPKKADLENSEVKQGKVSYVTENGLKDIVITLEGVQGIFYIGSGVKKGLNADSLRQILVGHTATLYIAKPSFFTKFSPMTNTLSIYEVKLDGTVLYSNFDE